MLPRCSFLKDVFSGLRFCPNLLETVSLQVPHQNFRDWTWLNVDCKRRNCVARCAEATNAIESKTEIVNGRLVSVSVINWYLIFLVCYIY